MKIFGTDLGATKGDQAVALLGGTAFFVADWVLLWGITSTESFAIGVAAGLGAKRSIEATLQKPARHEERTPARRKEVLRRALLEELDRERALGVQEETARNLLHELDRLEAVEGAMTEEAFLQALDDIASRFAGSAQ